MTFVRRAHLFVRDVLTPRSVDGAAEAVARAVYVARLQSMAARTVHGVVNVDAPVLLRTRARFHHFRHDLSRNFWFLANLGERLCFEARLHYEVKLGWV